MDDLGERLRGRVQGRLQELVRLPDFTVPEGRWLELPRRGRTWLTDLAGPTPDAPAVVLLHAVGCTGLLTWFPALAALTERYRVITFDQRWHGRGIVSDSFAVSDCADDVAVVIAALDLVDPVVAGYSMGSIIAQRVWRQHPDVVGGLVLAATTDHFRNTAPERLFHAGMEFGMGSLRALARSRTLQRGALRTAEALVDTEASDTQEWALEEWRQTSPWAIGQAVASLGRFHSTPWLPRIDVPTAVVVTARDKVLSPDGQRRVAAAIPGATVHETPVGHAGCVLQADRFVPVLVEAVDTTAGRVESIHRARTR
ncbi:MAG TPA: alpha/beta fold hydrolase [Marmoricola sp.]|jgi:pimeloyl-ACP methyl ester carboxylesterase|nr:alpha/beta fold hydrolase [Marmoricola sp.]